MWIAENAQFVVAREAEVRHDGDHGYIMMIIESLRATVWLFLLTCCLCQCLRLLCTGNCCEVVYLLQ